MNGQPRSPSAELPPTSKKGRGAASASSSCCSCVNVGSLIVGPRYHGASQLENFVPIPPSLLTVALIRSSKAARYSVSLAPSECPTQPSRDESTSGSDAKISTATSAS